MELFQAAYELGRAPKTRQLQAHHYAWLRVHPTRSEVWLRYMLRQGFDVHHLDGDHANNEPSNLALMEHEDHLRLHGFSMSMSRVRFRRVVWNPPDTGTKPPASAAIKAKPAPKEIDYSRSKVAYDLRIDGNSWESIAAGIGLKNYGVARRMAQGYVKAFGLEWPINISEDALARDAKVYAKTCLRCYELRAATGKPWTDVAGMVENETGQYVRYPGDRAMRYAKLTGKPWPIHR